MIIHLYTLCWNEIDILPFVIDYWKRIPVTKAIVYDNGSTDGSVEYLQQYDWIEVRHFETEGMNDAVQRDIKNSCWKESKGNADFVIVCDTDEVLYSNNFNEELEYMKKNGYNVLGTPWYALCGDNVPEYKNGALLHEVIKKAYKQDINRTYHDLGKFMLFDQNVIDDMNYEVGCHASFPKPQLNLYKSNNIFAIHFDKGFGVDYVIKRRKIMNERLSEINKKNNWCFEYGLSEEKIKEEYENKQSKSIDITKILSRNLTIFIGAYKDYNYNLTNDCYKLIVGNHEIKNNSNLELIKCGDKDDKLDDRFFSELYMLKYVSENIGLTKYVGYCHYRKYFSFLNDIPDMDELFKEYDCMVAKPIKLPYSIKTQYASCHNIDDLYIIGGILAEKYPDFKEYIKFIFDILDEYVKIIGTDIYKRIAGNNDKYIKKFSPNNTTEYQYRIGGYLAERLTNIFLMKHFKKMKTFDVIITEEKYNKK